MNFMKKAVIYSSISALLFLATSSISQAENLNEIFSLARKADPEWAAKKQKYLADREKLEQAYGGLLPSAEASGSWAKQYYDGGTLGADRDAATQCIIDNNIPFDVSGIIDFIDLCDRELFGYQSIDQDYDVTTYSLSATQPLFRMDRWHRYKRARILDNAAKAELANNQQELMIRSAEAYFGALRAQEEHRLAQSEEKTLRTQLTEIKNRYKLGLMRDTDVFEVQAQHDIAKAAVIVAKSHFDSAMENLVMLTNTPIQQVNPLPKDIPVEPPQPFDLADWEDFARRTNYTLLAAQFAAEGAEKEILESKAGHSPTADLFLNYSHSEVGGGFTPSADTTTIGVRFSLPLYTGGATSSRVRESEYRAQEAKHNVELARRNAIRETRQYYTRVNADVASVQARLRAVKSNNSSLRAVRNGWENGIRTLADVLTSQRNVYQARKEFTTSRYDYILNTLKLKKAAGVLSPDDLQTLNSWLDSPNPETISTVLDEEADYLEQVDDIKFERELKTFDDEKKSSSKSHKSLYDAFKAWRKDD